MSIHPLTDGLPPSDASQESDPANVLLDVAGMELMEEIAGEPVPAELIRLAQQLSDALRNRAEAPSDETTSGEAAEARSDGQNGRLSHGDPTRP